MFKRKRNWIVGTLGILTVCILIVAAFAHGTPLTWYYYVKISKQPDRMYGMLTSREGSPEREALKNFLYGESGRRWLTDRFKSGPSDIHPWMRWVPPSHPFSFLDSGKVDQYWCVPEVTLPLARTMLMDTDIVEVSNGVTQQLGVQVGLVPAGCRLFLVRALFMEKGVEYEIWHEGEKLLVDHSVFGSARTKPIKEAALVLPLVSHPKDVFVQCAMDH